MALQAIAAEIGSRGSIRFVTRTDSRLTKDGELIPILILDEQDRKILTGTVLYARHALVKKALTTFEEDPLLLSFLASATYTALNIWLEEVTDHHERVFHGLLADHVLSHVAAREDAT